MQPRIVKSTMYDFQEAQWDGVNRSGYKVFSTRVLVMIDVAPDKSAGGIMITGSQQDQQQQACETGVIVSMGGAAFTRSPDRLTSFGDERPKPGDRIYFQRYAGQYLKGADDVMYRVMEDTEIAALRDADAFNKPKAIEPAAQLKKVK